MSIELKQHKPITVNPKDVKVGDFMQLSRFVRVTQVHAGGRKLSVVDVDNNLPFVIEGNELVEHLNSADRYITEEKLPRTEVAKILETSFNVPFTVCFEKLNGEERTLRGRLLCSAPFGRSEVVDIDVVKGSPLRLVDHRTLKWLIVRGVKYTVNSK